MKFLLKVSFAAIILSTIIFGCRKPKKVDEAFVGEWRAALEFCNITVTIPAKGRARYYKLCDSTYVETKGYPYVRVKKKILVVGKKEFEIGANREGKPAPTYTLGGTWELSLDGVLYTKVN